MTSASGELPTFYIVNALGIIQCGKRCQFEIDFFPMSRPRSYYRLDQRFYRCSAGMAGDAKRRERGDIPLSWPVFAARLTAEEQHECLRLLRREYPDIILPDALLSIEPTHTPFKIIRSSLNFFIVLCQIDDCLLQSFHIILKVSKSLIACSTQ